MLEPFQLSVGDIEMLDKIFNTKFSFPPSLKDFEILKERYHKVNEYINNLDTMDFSDEIKNSFRTSFDLITNDYKEIERRVEQNENCIVLKFRDVYKRLDELLQLLLFKKIIFKIN